MSDMNKQNHSLVARAVQGLCLKVASLTRNLACLPGTYADQLMHTIYIRGQTDVRVCKREMQFYCM